MLNIEKWIPKLLENRMEENHFHKSKQKHKVQGQILTEIVQNLQQENHKYFLRIILRKIKDITFKINCFYNVAIVGMILKGKSIMQIIII